MQIHDSKSDFVKAKLSEAFVYGGLGAALFQSQKTGIEPVLYNLTKYYTNSILPAIQKGLLFVAEEDDKVVGLTFGEAGLNVMYRLKAPVITGAFTIVDPEYRRRGIATALRINLLEEFRKQGYKIAFCQIDEVNDTCLSSLKPFFETIKYEKFNTFKIEL